jgi:hypothetical protein
MIVGLVAVLLMDGQDQNAVVNTLSKSKPKMVGNKK